MDSSKVDASRNSAVAEPPDGEAANSGREARKSPRRAFRAIQMIAPCDDGEMPSKSEFRRVVCHDISTGGFSFFWPDSPQFTKVVAALGTASALTYLNANVIHAKPTSQFKGGYLVGCQFVDRIDLPD